MIRRNKYTKNWQKSRAVGVPNVSGVPAASGVAAVASLHAVAGLHAVASLYAVAGFVWLAALLPGIVACIPPAAGSSVIAVTDVELTSLQYCCRSVVFVPDACCCWCSFCDLGSLYGIYVVAYVSDVAGVPAVAAFFSVAGFSPVADSPAVSGCCCSTYMKFLLFRYCCRPCC